jgi:RNA polymerase sigma-70 factor (ECF subfamily)
MGVPAAGVEDAAQEVLFVVHRRLGEFVPGTILRAWLFTIASHVAKNFRRASRRREVREAAGLPAPGPTPGPEVEVAGHEAVELTERFMAGLDQAKRAVFLLALIEGMPAPEVAMALQIPVNTVYSRIRLIRQEFRALLARHYQQVLR